MKLSVVITILNEEKTISHLLQSINDQSLLPDEVIIVDGGSIDKSIKLIKSFTKLQKKGIEVKIIQKKGNRSVGRNEGIQAAKHEVILITDAGCALDKHCIEEISKPFNNKSVSVVAGYYSAKPVTVFQKCLVPYILVMPDRVKAKNFLPATRSMAMKKKQL